MDHKHDPLKELTEIRNQLSYSKRLGFLFGAGTSKAIGISDISELTAKIDSELKAHNKTNFDKVRAGLDADNQHIEAVLNQVRLIRQITQDSSTKSFDDITGVEAKELDAAICNEIYKIISEEESKAKLEVVKRFMSWLNWLSRDYPKEIFTTNYDLVIEKAAESQLIPFYDGFVGANEPFFNADSLETKNEYNRPPTSWIRLWKLHGSLGWFWKENEDKVTHRVIRLSSEGKTKYPDAELVIYPSRDKYETSRKQPFVSYIDKLKAFLLDGEGIFIVSGYSFSDEHLNEVIFNALNQNSRLHVIAFFYSDDPLEKLVKAGKNLPNLTLIGEKKASVSGTSGEWNLENTNELLDPFWDKSKKSIKLGDFKELVNFLILCSGLRENEKG